MNKPLVYGGVLIAIVLAIGSYYFPQGANLAGSTGSRFPSGISADATSPTAGQVRGTTLTTTGAATFGGTVTVTTTNAATSTVSVGCVQAVASTTATPIKLVIGPANASAS